MKELPTQKKTFDRRVRDLVADGDVEPGAVRGGFVVLALACSFVLGVSMAHLGDAGSWWWLVAFAALLGLYAAMRVLRALKRLEEKCGGCLHPQHAADCPSVWCSCPDREATA